MGYKKIADHNRKSGVEKKEHEYADVLSFLEGNADIEQSLSSIPSITSNDSSDSEVKCLKGSQLLKDEERQLSMW